MKVTAQAGYRENWATAGTRHLANHPPEEKKINQLKKALKDLVVFTNHHRGRTRHHPQPVPLQSSGSVSDGNSILLIWWRSCSSLCSVLWRGDVWSNQLLW